MAVYKLSAHETLEGSVEEIVSALLANYRGHLYRRPVVEIIVPEEGNRVVRFYKSRQKLCPACGAIHGRDLALIPEIAPDFSALFQAETCALCRKAPVEEKPWMREFLPDGGEA